MPESRKRFVLFGFAPKSDQKDKIRNRFKTWVLSVLKNGKPRTQAVFLRRQQHEYYHKSVIKAATACKHACAVGVGQTDNVDESGVLVDMSLKKPKRFTAVDVACVCVGCYEAWRFNLELPSKFPIQ